MISIMEGDLPEYEKTDQICNWFQIIRFFNLRQSFSRLFLRHIKLISKKSWDFSALFLDCDFTKYRHKSFTTNELSDEMKEILWQVAEDNEIVIEKMEVMPDYVHVLISFPPGEVPTSDIKALKDRSAFIFLRRHPEIRRSQSWGGHLWSPGYYIGTPVNMSKEAVEKHINDQKYNEMKKALYKVRPGRSSDGSHGSRSSILFNGFQ